MIRGAVAAVLLAPAVLAVAIAASGYPTVRAGPGPAIAGVFHVHTSASHDGHGSLDEVAAAAKEAGASFAVITDHESTHADLPRRIDDVLLVSGVELTADAGHVIVVGGTELSDERGAGVLPAIAAAGGFAVLAHPVNARRPWTDPSPDGFGGFEALSLDSAFRDASVLRLALAGGALLGDPRKAGAMLVARPGDALHRYDELTARRPVTLVCGVDAHGIPAYEVSFRALQLHIPAIPGWGEDVGDDAESVRVSLRQGRTFCSVPALGDAASFSFVRTGAVVSAAVQADGATISLFRDGVVVARGPSPRVEAPAEAGAWRAEVTVEPGFPYPRGPALWIASSAIRVGPR